MNPELLKQAGIDYNAGMKRFMNGSNLYEAVLTAFVNSDVLERAREAHNACDKDKLFKALLKQKALPKMQGYKTYIWRLVL